MIDTEEMRRLTQAALVAPDGLSAEWMDRLGQFQEYASPAAVSELLDRLETAESEALEQARLNGMGAEREAALLSKLEAAERERDECKARRLEAADHFSEQVREISSALEETRRERDVEQQRACDLHVECYNLITEIDALRAKIEQMERQEPVAKVRINQTGGNAGVAWSAQPLNDFDSLPLLRDGDKLYALPGAQAQPAPSIMDAIIDDLQSQFDSEGITEHDSGDALIRLSDAIAAVEDNFVQPAPSVPDDVMRDAERYRLIRRGQHWSVVDGIGDHLRADDLDSAVDRALAAVPESKP